MHVSIIVSLASSTGSTPISGHKFYLRFSRAFVISTISAKPRSQLLDPPRLHFVPGLPGGPQRLRDSNWSVATLTTFVHNIDVWSRIVSATLLVADAGFGFGFH